MRYNPDTHHRCSIRLKDYDYSKKGMYFITICTKNRECILSEITNVGAGHCARPDLILSNFGMKLQKYLLNIPKINNNVKINEYVIMPDHIHVILGLGQAR